jgi:protoporphyrinogen/coproporphyrinogen III oxidase
LAERAGDGKERHRVIVIGGGLSGLTVAHRVHERARTLRRGVEVVVLDARDRVGGVISTERFDGFTLEHGPDSFITNKPWGLDLCNKLGLADQLIETDAGKRRSFVVRNGRLAPVPEGFVLMAPNRLLPILTTPILSVRGKLRLLLDLVIPRRSDESEESLGSFVRRRFGREALDRLVQPLVAGIYTADPYDLSLNATFPQFPAMEREHGSVIRALRREARERGPRHLEKQASGARYGLFVTLADGMGMLPEALAAALPHGTVRTDTAVRRISRNEPVSPWLVELLDGPPLEADAVVVATEAHAAARFLDAQDPALALQLRAIPYASSLIANVAYRRDQISHPLDGFGAVVPATELRSILAVSFLSVKFPNRAPAGTVLLRVFIGGVTQPEQLENDDAAVTALVQQELGGLIGASGEPIFTKITRHPRAMPQYNLGHLDRVAAIRRNLAKYSRLYLAGIGYDGVGIPDCIHAAGDTADRLIDALAKPAASAA